MQNSALYGRLPLPFAKTNPRWLLSPRAGRARRAAALLPNERTGKAEVHAPKATAPEGK